MTVHRPWTAEQDQRIRSMRAAGAPWRSVAAAVGRTYASAVARGGQLGVCTPMMPRWTPAEDFRLLGMLEQHHAFARIATRLGRSVVAVRARASEIGAALRTANGATVAQVARDLGVGRHTVTWWIARRWLRAHTAGARRGHGTPRMIERADLEAFLEAERFWHLVDPARVADPDLRAWLLDVRDGVTFLSTEEAGARLALTGGRVRELAQEGRIRSVRRGHAMLIRSDWVVVPPEKPRTPGPRQVTEADHDRIRRLWGRRPATRIAAQLGCKSTTGVMRAARALGLPPLGRGYWRRRRAA